MSGDGHSKDRDREQASLPVRKIADASYDRPPRSDVRRRLMVAKRWFLLDMDRLLLTGLLSFGLFVFIVVAGTFGPVPVESFLGTGVSPGSILVELLKMIASVVVIVLSINQLVLSPGMGSIGDQNERFDQSVDLRERLEAHTDVRTSPASPAAFLHVLLASIVERTEQFRETVTDGSRGELEADVVSFTEDLGTEAERVERVLPDGRFGKFDAMSAVMRVAITGKERALRDLRARHGDALSPRGTELLDEVEELLELFTVSREYFKTAYIRSDYIELSQALLYAGLPCIALTYYAAQAYAPGVFPGRTLGIAHQLLFVSGAVTVALVPFVLMLAYVFRLSLLSRSTVFIGPFAARSSSESHPGEPDTDS
jgi:hypothetical protein